MDPNNYITILQTENGAEFKNKAMNQFYQENNIQQVYGVPYNPQHQGAGEAFNKTVQDFLTLARNHQGDSYYLEDLISDFLLYYNNRKHSTTKVAHYKAMMNIDNKALMNEIKYNTIQRRSKAKMSSETFQENSYVRASNYTRILDGGYIRFHQQLGIQKKFAKEKMICSS